MRLLSRGIRGRSPALIGVAVLFLVISWTLFAYVHFGGKSGPVALGDQEFELRFPLAWRHVQTFQGRGGSWYIPPEWIAEGEDPPRTILDAARLASRVAMADPAKQIRFSKVPLLVHQVFISPKEKRVKLDPRNANIISYVERWLAYATSSQHGRMAYFFWDGEGLADFFREYELDFYDKSIELFSVVERVDIFRILLCKRFGGIYGDVDTVPLQHPSTWIHPNDIATWTDDATGQSYGYPVPSKASPDSDPQQDQPVNILFGLEADTDPASDDYWRMGYDYPVQLTQWALASAPGHPVLSRFMEDLDRQIQSVTERVQREAPATANMTAELKAQMARVDTLSLTGPAAVTFSTMSWLKEEVGFRWEAVTGLKDGGRAKLVKDVLVLPITGFSPGRGKYGNMGSKPYDDPDARLAHHAQGSWRRFDIKVEFGKFCRSVFGMCRDWPKMPG